MKSKKRSIRRFKKSIRDKIMEIGSNLTRKTQRKEKWRRKRMRMVLAIVSYKKRKNSQMKKRRKK